MLEPRLPLSASSIGGKPYVDIGPSDSVAWDQPRVTVQLINELEQIVGPNTFNVWLLDTGANTILSFQTAINDMNASPPFYEVEGVFSELGVGGEQLFDISRAYQFDFAGESGIRNTIPGTRIISDSNRDISQFGPWGIVGMPAMTERVTTLDLSVWTTLVDLQLFMEVDFADEVPAYSGPRYSVRADNRIEFHPEPQVVSGNNPPVWADVPFITGQMLNGDNVAEGNMLFDTGAQVSILSSEMAFQLGLDTNQDGVLNNRDASFARSEVVGGIGGFVEVPVFLIDEVHIPTNEGPDLVWTDLQWLVLDIYPGIDGVFGFDNITSGWIEAYGVDDKSGFIQKSHLDFRGYETTGVGTIYFDITPDIHAVVDPNGPGAAIVESGGLTSVSETGINDSYTVALTQPPTANVTVTLSVPDDRPGSSDPLQIAAVSAANPSNSFLVFTPENWDVPQTVLVTANDDSYEESFHRTYVRHISSSADPRYDAVGMPRVIVNITDNDFPGMMIIPSNGSTDVTEGGAGDTYQLVLTQAPTADVSITMENVPGQVTAVSSVDGTNSIIFTPANWDIPQTILVTAVDDLIDEGPHKGYITHILNTSDENFAQAFLLQEVAAITDNDSLDVTPPTIVDVIVASSSWSPGFIDAVDGGGLGAGNGLGLSLPGAGQLDNLPWSGIDRIYLKFSEDVSSSFSRNHLALVGSNVANYLPRATTNYSVVAPDTAAISLTTPIQNDILWISVADTLTDAAGNRLDGEWTSSVSSTSGNNLAGGRFNFRVDVIPGDVDNSDDVKFGDVLATHQARGAAVDSLANARMDIDGSGGVRFGDVLIVNGLRSSILPPVPAPPGGSTGGGTGVGFGPSLFLQLAAPAPEFRNGQLVFERMRSIAAGLHENGLVAEALPATPSRAASQLRSDFHGAFPLPGSKHTVEPFAFPLPPFSTFAAAVDQVFAQQSNLLAGRSNRPHLVLDDSVTMPGNYNEGLTPRATEPASRDPQPRRRLTVGGAQSPAGLGIGPAEDALREGTLGLEFDERKP